GRPPHAAPAARPIMAPESVNAAAANVPPSATLERRAHPIWDGRTIPFDPAWQWVRLGVYELPAEPFRLRLSDPRGDARLDQMLLTTDLDYSPGEDRK
ncbi:MAG TPA: hypothetical protein VEJ18_00025, partial [Planctomycetota bacterium]|nr:hypothetical protein [Planctomycetota bacterium]